MKNRSFPKRMNFAMQGIRIAWQKEASFRTQVVCGGAALLSLAVLRPGALWSALVILVTAAVLAAEMINTALEAVVDRLHPEIHPLIARAKDCAAGAVLILSLSAVLIYACLLWDRFLV